MALMDSETHVRDGLITAARKQEEIHEDGPGGGGGAKRAKI